MKQNVLEQLFFNFFSKNTSSKELVELSKALREDKNKALFKKYIKIHYLVTYNMCDFNTKEEKEKLFKAIKKEQKRKKIVLNTVLKYGIAAAVITLFCITWFFNYNKNTNTDITPTETISKADQIILPGSDKAILTLENGEHIVLGEGERYSNKNISSNGEHIIYKNTKEKTVEIANNSLTIPRGGQFFIILSDGTKVWLNSETKFRYPVHFVKGKPRVVELLYGEAYFDVSESEHHGGSIFKVIGSNQDIEVLGTEFNVKAYPDQDNVLTTLVEGKVNVYNDTAKNALAPGMQSVVNINSGNISVKEVEVASAIAWKNGFFSFENETLEDMLKTLSRWYEIEVYFDDESKKNLIFSGLLKRKGQIETLLSYIEKTGRVNFEIKNNLITVK